jgi:hypothetical protein
MLFFCYACYRVTYFLSTLRQSAIICHRLSQPPIFFFFCLHPSRMSTNTLQQIVFVISKPDVFKAAGSDTYVIFGEAKVEDLSAAMGAMNQAAAASGKYRLPGGCTLHSDNCSWRWYNRRNAGAGQSRGWRCCRCCSCRCRHGC